MVTKIEGVLSVKYLPHGQTLSGDQDINWSLEVQDYSTDEENMMVVRQSCQNSQLCSRAQQNHITPRTVKVALNMSILHAARENT